MDRETWRAAVHGVTNSWTRLSGWTELKKEWNCVIFRDMDGSRDCRTEWSKSEKDKNRYGILTQICGIKKNDIDDLTCKAEIEPQMWKTNIWILMGKKQGWDGLGGWDWHIYTASAAAAAAKSLQCLTLCDPIDGSPPGSVVLGILQARTLEWVVISFSNAWKWKVKVKSLSHVRLFATPWTAPYQAPPSMGFSRQEYWSGVPLPSLIYIHYYVYIGNSQVDGW